MSRSLALLTRSSGCVIVSTNVDGVPELLPESKGFFVAPTEDALVRGVSEAIRDVQNNPVRHPRELTSEDKRILAVYDWGEVTSRVESVYNEVVAMPHLSMRDEFEAFWGLGFVSL